MTSDTADLVLPTYSILSRFRVEAESSREAVESVVARLTAAEEPFHEVTVEPREPDGSWLVDVRFVLVSVDGHTAVLGLDETLRGAGVTPLEVWADKQVA
jgi:hypothetical protein